MTFKLSRLSAFVATLGATQAAFAADPQILGWTSQGDADATTTGRFTLTTASLTNVDDAGFAAGALNVSGRALATSASLESFMGAAPGSLGATATEGSAMMRKKVLLGGDWIWFDWQLTTRDTDPALDYAFVIIGNQRFDLGRASDATLPSGSPWLGQTLTGHFVFKVQQAANYTIAFGIVDAGGNAGTSALTLTNVAMIPEPSSYALMLGGGALLLAAKRRRKG